MKKMELTILMPCLNEEKTIKDSILKAKRFLNENNIDGEILIVDNGSTDKSLKIIKSLRVRYIIVLQKGYGNALREGFKASLGKYIIMGDSDNTYDFYHLKPFLDLMNDYDLVVGNRFVGGIEKGAMPLLNRYFGNPFLSFLGRKYFPTEVHDFHCGLRCFNKEKILALNLTSEGMELSSEMIIKAIKKGYRITEIPTTLVNNHTNRKPHLRPIRDSIRHIKVILKEKNE